MIPREDMVPIGSRMSWGVVKIDSTSGMSAKGGVVGGRNQQASLGVR